MSDGHPLFVRITHWITAVAALGLIVSGVAILVAHPRLYWGETGVLGGPSLIDLPIPFLLGHSGWGRYLHFLSAWVGVGCGLCYLGFGIATRHFVRHLAPWEIVRPGTYNARQRLVYLVVVFALGPLVLLSGLAFSPALRSVMPSLVSVFGGQQSARTIHFFAAVAVVLFIVVHVTMVWRAGLGKHLLAMVTGAAALELEDT
jgi:thiosulfate reductase cytochrome b subunit